MPVYKVKSDSTGKEFLESNKDALVVLFFDAEFTGQSSLVDAAINAVTSELKDKVVLGTVDVEENNNLAQEYSILSVPMVVCITKGKLVKKIDTLEPQKLVKSLEEELRRIDLLAGDVKEENQDPKERFNDYLKKIINRAPVMVFMKGEPKAPRCGFSRQLVDLLAKHQIVYETFDILQDEDVRQGLKEYSDWPTYPQIYAKGEFVGGLDILKQMEESGELESTLRV